MGLTRGKNLKAQQAKYGKATGQTTGSGKQADKPIARGSQSRNGK